MNGGSKFVRTSIGSRGCVGLCRAGAGAGSAGKD